MNTFVNNLLKQRTFSLKSEGYSMLPILRTGDTVEYRKCSFYTLKTNDIVLIKKKGVLMTHRVIYKKILKPASQRGKQVQNDNRSVRDDRKVGFLITKGDNNPTSDGKIYPYQIIAKAIRVKRNSQFVSIDQIYLIQSSYYFQEIVKVKNAFEKQKIDLVFLKGLPLHLYYEGAHPRRIYADCDILIYKEFFVQAEQILIANGYKKADIHWSQTVKKMQERDVEIVYYKTINGMTVTFDIHLQIDLSIVHLGKLEALYPQKRIDQLTTECLQTKKQIKVNNEKFSILNPQFSIIYLALHLFHHNFTGAFRYEFLDKVIRKVCHAEFISASVTTKTLKHREQKFQCKQVQDDVVRFRLQNFVYPVFILLKKYYKTPISQRFFHSIQPVNPLTRKLVNQIIKTNIFNDKPRIQAGITRFEYLFYLSPNPWWMKMWVFVHPQVTYTIFWVITRRIKNLFLRFY